MLVFQSLKVLQINVACWFGTTHTPKPLGSAPFGWARSMWLKLMTMPVLGVPVPVIGLVAAHHDHPPVGSKRVVRVTGQGVIRDGDVGGSGHEDRRLDGERLGWAAVGKSPMPKIVLPETDPPGEPPNRSAYTTPF